MVSKYLLRAVVMVNVAHAKAAMIATQARNVVHVRIAGDAITVIILENIIKREQFYLQMT
jgi:hypothetical protein